MLKPLHDNVVLEKEEIENKTSSGIILNAADKDQPSIAKVVAVGDGKLVDGKKVPLQVKVNERVVYKEYSTTKIEYEGKEYLVISEEDILAVVE
jgi:Co-chaperonin GroES (HSP10)